MAGSSLAEKVVWETILRLQGIYGILESPRITAIVSMTLGKREKPMFSYDDYREIIRIIKSTGRQCGYREALTRDRFLIMRHDVEYSVDRAWQLAKVEQSMDFTSTFFFQWTNNSYNILSRKNMDIIKEMHERGQHIGLHFALNGMTDMERIKKRIRMEVDILSEMFGFQIREFSIHRPSKDVLRENIKLDGLLNAYQDEFFTFADDITEHTKLNVKYMSDANHIWRYGYPNEENIRGFDKVQILVHPFAWSREGGSNFENYRGLIREKYQEMVESVDNECKDFGEYRDYFMEKDVR